MSPNEIELESLFGRGDQIRLLQFLRDLKPSERKKLKSIRNLLQEQHKYGIARHEHPWRMLGLADLFILSRTAFERAHLWNSWEIIEYAYDAGVFQWYQPTWFRTYLERLETQNTIISWVSYRHLLYLEEEGFFSPSPELIVRFFPRSIFERVPRSGRGGFDYQYQPSNLELFPRTLETHLWWLFDYESEVNGWSFSQILDAPTEDAP